MVLPWLLAGGFALSSLYGAGQAIESYRYWRDYYHNTGIRPRYPFRSGAYNGISNLSHGFYGAYGLSKGIPY